jgi:hypothetical protein
VLRVREILNQQTESKEFAQVTAQIEFFLRSGLGDFNAAQSALNIKKITIIAPLSD